MSKQQIVEKANKLINRHDGYSPISRSHVSVGELLDFSNSVAHHFKDFKSKNPLPYYSVPILEKNNLQLDYFCNGFIKHEIVKENLLEFYKQINKDKKIEVASSVYDEAHCIDIYICHGEHSLTVLSRFFIYNQEQLDFVLNNCSRYK